MYGNQLFKIDGVLCTKEVGTVIPYVYVFKGIKLDSDPEPSP